jgi:hypothetical protein
VLPFGILAFQSGDAFCVPRPQPATLGFFDGGWRPSLLARRLVRALSPTLLSAAATTKSTGGTAGGLKSIFGDKLVPSAALKFVAPFPSSTPKVNSPITVTLQAKSSDGVLMNGVTATLSGSNNNGNFTALGTPTGSTCTVTSPPTPPSGVTGTSGFGLVEITFCVNKTGGLIVTANATVPGRPTTKIAPDKIKLNIKP